MKECGAKENWTIRKTSEMLKHLVDIARDRFETYAAPFHALHSTGTFNRNCQVTGCAALKGPCGKDGKTLVVGLKSVELMEFLVERYMSSAGQVVLNPFMGSGSGGIAALRKGRCFLGYEQKMTNFFSAVFYLASALGKSYESRRAILTR